MKLLVWIQIYIKLFYICIVYCCHATALVILQTVPTCAEHLRMQLATAFYQRVRSALEKENKWMKKYTVFQFEVFTKFTLKVLIFLPARSLFFEFVFLWCRLPLMLFSCEFVFLCGFLPVRLSSCEIIFLWGHLPVRLSSCEVVLLWGRHPVRLTSFAVVFLWGRLPVKLSSC